MDCQTERIWCWLQKNSENFRQSHTILRTRFSFQHFLLVFLYILQNARSKRLWIFFSNYSRKFYDQQAFSILADGFTFCWQGKCNLETLILSYIAYSNNTSISWKFKLLKCTTPCDIVWCAFNWFWTNLRKHGLQVIPRLFGPFFWQAWSHIY